MSEEHINDPLKPLEQIREVEPSPFLFTRIRQAVETRRLERISPVKATLAGLAFCLLLLLNTLVLLRSTGPVKPERQTTSAFGLLPQNSLYP